MAVAAVPLHSETYCKTKRCEQSGVGETLANSKWKLQIQCVQSQAKILIINKKQSLTVELRKPGTS